MPTSQKGDRITETVRFDGVEDARRLLGPRDRNLRQLRDAFHVRVAMRGDSLTIDGETIQVKAAAAAVRKMLAYLQTAQHLLPADVERIMAGQDHGVPDSGGVRIDVMVSGRSVRPRTPGQVSYIRAMQSNDLVFCMGPAGTGKTYLAVAMAVSALKRNVVRRIVLTRPAIEAGERLGFLPGDMQAKVNPYLRPLYDALNDMMAVAQVRRYVESDLIEIAPLAYMRGRTLDHAFIILDEGQNCTSKQMKMFLTRLGASSKSIVTGDVSQTDLPSNEVSGMREAAGLLRGVKGNGFVHLTQRDIIRHRLVQDIVDAYAAETRASLPETTARHEHPETCDTKSLETESNG